MKSASVDLLIKNAKIVTSFGRMNTSIAICGGRIAAVGDHRHLPRPKRILDVDGCIVIPGLIDGHAHL